MQSSMTRRSVLALSALAACKPKNQRTTPMPNPLPTRPNGHVAIPELFVRWNAMFHDSGARNLMGQMALHAEMCDDTLDCIDPHKTIPNVHHSPDFVLWHRAFLYYHEQILSALGGIQVGLPYWDWTIDRLCPTAFDAGKFDFGGSLAHSENQLGDENFSAQNIIAVVVALRSLRPEVAAAQLFDEPIHKLVHFHFGWDHRGDLMMAAGDPAFYGHHGNLDRLATHIFQGGWPSPSGLNYHFFGPDNKATCTTIDGFAAMASPYQGDQPLDTSGYQVQNLELLDRTVDSSYSRVRMRLHFSSPLKMGAYQVLSGKGTPLGQIASIDHHGESDFTLWVTLENYRKAQAEGVQTTEHVTAGLTGALLVSKGD
jgi:hypothetical protein